MGLVTSQSAIMEVGAVWRKKLNTGQPGSRGGQDIPIKGMPLVPTSSNQTLSPNSLFGYGLVS